ncbi:flavanone 3-dioxygenase 2-like isoform X1 [Hordeum vulgare subsp. vulgare]|uniref:Predicted protein n=1 Tax=Hordeum vulgare subsp. vulgare TaxID=112509 RepID=F2DTW9_HORVV|nr:flavanone 3-dioxygenase 2-like isoform X1 [Hordeum vulgare subsp. vulgare]BAJ98540.1 predicted protein [Hordeum vulgare subsp. vulgare]
MPDADIPVIYLTDPDRTAVVSQIGAACTSHGFFLVLIPILSHLHGALFSTQMALLCFRSQCVVSDRQVLNHRLQVAHDFFRLSLEEKAKLYSDDPAKKMRLSTSFNMRKETVHNWRDYLRLHCYPLEQFVPEWPAYPPPFSLL